MADLVELRLLAVKCGRLMEAEDDPERREELVNAILYLESVIGWMEDQAPADDKGLGRADRPVRA